MTTYSIQDATGHIIHHSKTITEVFNLLPAQSRLISGNKQVKVKVTGQLVDVEVKAVYKTVKGNYTVVLDKPC